MATAPKTPVKTDVDPWGDTEIQFEKRIDKKNVVRPKVDVPPRVLELVKKAFGGEWLIVAITGPEDYESRANVLYSAGQMLENASVMVVPGIVEDGNFYKTDLEKATHLRATVAQRRGRKSST